MVLSLGVFCYLERERELDMVAKNTLFHLHISALSSSDLALGSLDLWFFFELSKKVFEFECNHKLATVIETEKCVVSHSFEVCKSPKWKQS